MNVSICIPIIRPEKAKRCIAAIEQHAPGAEIVTDVDTNRIGCPKMLKRLVDRAKHDLICFLGDDTIPQEGFLDEALKAMATLPGGWGVVGLSDGTGRELPTHWLASKWMLPLLGGEFFSTAYQHCFCDRELWDIAKEHNRYVMCRDAKVEHDHPMIRHEHNTDEDLKRVYSDVNYYKDRATYTSRKRARLGEILGVAFPILDGSVPRPFFTSYVTLEKPNEFNYYEPELPHGGLADNLAVVRNSLVRNALLDGCTYLFMADTDQRYPSNALTKLLSNKKDICGALVHKRWPHFNPVCLKGDIGHYDIMPDEQMFSGKVIEVDATGTGCLLFNMRVFDKIPEPWFKFGVNERGESVGEDIYFCSKARKAGFQIFVDTSIRVKHLTRFEVDENIYKLHRMLLGRRESK